MRSFVNTLSVACGLHKPVFLGSVPLTCGYMSYATSWPRSSRWRLWPNTAFYNVQELRDLCRQYLVGSKREDVSRRGFPIGRDAHKTCPEGGIRSKELRKDRNTLVLSCELCEQSNTPGRERTIDIDPASLFPPPKLPFLLERSTRKPKTRVIFKVTWLPQGYAAFQVELGGEQLSGERTYSSNAV